MFHNGTQTLIDHWAALPDSARIPAARNLEPMRLGRLVPQLFSADRELEGATFRLAGGWIESLHGRALGGMGWLEFWAPESRSLVTRAVMQTFREARPVVLVAEAARLRGVLEIVIAPMRGPDGEPNRLVGLYQPALDQQERQDAIGPLTARLSVGVGIAGRPPLTLAAIDGRRIA